MKKSEVLAHFKGVSKVAAALGISPGAVSQWPEDVPVLRQLQIQALTGGQLRASADAQKFAQPAA
ncbi:Cro/CI family transcriptional regulator [Bowmanella yangjiangensis]|uniref:Cro/Cl family transcriptional regulator n=1 Tax=Bowmanella yangjiangensis TaxID=2811230 RepID=A0ABS3CYM4_9ALTE|nr:Cro/CI family transcriptional regulator [Bowmanella yangjiangensis]MBN7822227.1 Cro/Cl family transcriptional regulator [Bowmanella yangjiangensis]